MEGLSGFEEGSWRSCDGNNCSVDAGASRGRCEYEWGANGLGGGHVPLDPTYGVDQLNMLIDDTGLVGIVTLKTVWSRFVERGGVRRPGRRILLVDGVIVRGKMKWRLTLVTSLKGNYHQHTCVLYTGCGSTGRPKGVVWEGRGVIDQGEGGSRTMGPVCVNGI